MKYYYKLILSIMIVIGVVSFARSQTMTITPEPLTCGTYDITVTFDCEWNGQGVIWCTDPNVDFTTGGVDNINHGVGTVEIQVSSGAPDPALIEFQVTVVDSGTCVSQFDIFTDNVATSCSCSLTASISSSQDESCSGACDGTATVTPSGGSGNYSYLWDDPNTQTTQTATGLCAGTYNVTVTDNNDGCTATASVTIESGVCMEITPEPLTCGTYTITVTFDCSWDGEGFIWSTDSSVSFPNGVVDNVNDGVGSTEIQVDPGVADPVEITFQVSAVSSGTCVSQFDTFIDDVATSCAACSMTASISSSQDETCMGDCDGQATVTPSGGTSPHSYLWDDPSGQSTQTATGLCDGNYTVTVTDDNGCTATANVTINPGNSVTASASVDQHETCAGDCDGEATASGGTNYTWSNGQTTATATGLCAGMYDVTVTDNNGCSDIASVTINAGNSVSASATVDNHESCAGDCDGEATASGGTSYTWSNGATTAIVNNLCPGNYDVTVSDANGCSDVANVTINAGGSVTASASVDQHETCSGDCDGEATASGGTTYNWSTGETNPTITGLCPGNYSVTVSDANGCSDVTSVTINAGGSVTASASVDQHETCAGDCDGEATASGGTNYTWSNGATTATVTGLCPGNYDVTVSDANGCSDVTSVTINAGGSVTASASVDQHETCAGDCDGQATASGGTTYNWSTGETTATVTGLCPGNYDVTVSDANGCSDIASVTINAGTPMTDPTFSFNTTYCEDDSPFSLPTTSDNGVSGDWSGSGVSNNTFDPGAAGVGNWNITFTPTSGQCANTATVTMVVEDCGCQNPASADAGPNQEICASNTASVQLSGFINNANSATWTTSGSGSFDDPMALDAIYTPSQADKDGGSVTLTLTTEDPDGSGPCSPASDQMVVTLNFQPDIADYPDVENCFDFELPPYQGDVSNNVGYFDGQGGTGTSYNPGDIITETKTIFVYDETSEGCIDEVSFDVTINEVSADAGSDVEIPNGTTTTLMGAASDGSGDYAYAWSPDSLVVNPNQATTETEALSSNQTFTLEVTDNVTGSVSTDQVVITVTGGALAVNITAMEDTICDGGSTTLTANASGGSGSYTYDWSSDPSGFDADQEEVDVSPSETTVYTVTVDDGFNTEMASITIEVNNPPTVDVGDDRNVCSDVNQFSVTANVTGVPGGSWSTSGSGLFQDPDAVSTSYLPSQDDRDAGSVTLTFTTDDPAGPCGSVSDQMVVTFATVSADAGTDHDVQYGNAVQLEGSASGGSGNYTYSWTPAAKVVDATDPATMTEDLTQTTDFVLEVTDTSNDCTDRDTVRVTVLGGPLQASISPSTDTICLGSSTELEAVVSGGVTPYTYSWSSDPSGFGSDQERVTVSPEVATTYMVEVTDNDRNVVTAEATIVVNSLPLADAGPDHLICYDESSIELCATASANAVYGWTNASNGNYIFGQCIELRPAIWYLSVLDTITGCTRDDTVTIDQSEELIVELEPDSTITITGGTAPYDTTYERSGDTLSVTVIDANGCSATDEVMTTSVDNNALTEVSVYPNPATDHLMIKGLESQRYTITLYNSVGKKVLIDKNPSNRIPLSGLSAGTYYLRVLLDNGYNGTFPVHVIR